MRVTVIFISVFCSAVCVLGQSFKAEASLPAVNEDGFYRILISPDASVHLNREFTNIRIYEGQEKEVPFLFEVESSHRYAEEFKEYEILEKDQKEGCCTSLVLHNPDQNLLNNINLIIKNADVTKEAILLGSDDKQHWFALKQRFVLYPTTNTSGTSEIKIVDFPLSNYSYYSLRIDDSTSAPLNILKAGYFAVRTENGIYTDVLLRKIVKTDSVKQKKTYVHVQFDTLRMIDKLELSMKGSPYYLRKAMLYEQKEKTLKRGGKETYYSLLQEVELSSKHPSTIELPGIKVRDLLMVIENDDNPSLEIDFCKAFQLNRYLTAWLKKESQYTVKIGNDQLQTPVYDLSFFKDSIPSNPQVLSMGEMNVLTAKKMEPSFTFFTTKAFIWAAVVLVIVVLGFMSMQLLKETGTPENKKSD